MWNTKFQNVKGRMKPLSGPERSIEYENTVIESGGQEKALTVPGNSHAELVLKGQNHTD